MDCACTERPGRSTTRRLAVTALVVACILPTVLLVGIYSYVQHKLMMMNLLLHQVMHDCRCHHPLISAEAVSPAQVKVRSTQ